MAMIGKSWPVRARAFCFNDEKRSCSPATLPARTECFDIFSPPPGESEVTSQVERLSSNETKIAPSWVWIAVCSATRGRTAFMVRLSRSGGLVAPLCQRAGRAIHPHGIYYEAVRPSPAHRYFRPRD